MASVHQKHPEPNVAVSRPEVLLTSLFVMFFFSSLFFFWALQLPARRRENASDTIAKRIGKRV
jgi:hypothetical protein